MAKVATKKAKVKTVKKKAAPKKNINSSKQLQDMIEKLGFSVQKSIGDNHVNYNLVNPKTSDQVTSVSFNMCTIGYCCGVRESGDLYIAEADYMDDFSKDEKTALELLTALAFVDAANRDVSKRFGDRTGKVTTYRPLIFCSNGEGDCRIFEVVARKYLQGIYKLVSTSCNPGSANTIKTYISQL